MWAVGTGVLLLRSGSAPAATTTPCAPVGSATTPPSGQLANRLVGILHGCLATGTTYNEQTAWPHLKQDQPTAA